MEGRDHRDRDRDRGRGRGRGKGKGKGREQRQSSSIQGRNPGANNPQFHRGEDSARNSSSTRKDGVALASEQPVRQMAGLQIQQPRPSSSSQPCAASSSGNRKNLEPVSRPDAGGKKGSVLLDLIANHFHVNFHPAQQIFYYDVDMTLISPFSRQTSHADAQVTKSTISRADAEEIKNKLIAENREAFKNAMPVYDGKRKLYSSLPLTEGQFTVNLDDGELTKEYKVVLRLVQVLDGHGLAEFLNTDIKGHVSVEKELLQAMGLLVREHPSRSRMIMGRGLYSKVPDRQGYLSGGAVAAKGFIMSLRPTQQGLSLNVDLSVMSFHQSIPVLDYLWESRRVDCLEHEALSSKERETAESALTDLKVSVTHRRTRQKFTVRGLTKLRTSQLKFNLRERGEQEEMVSVVGYYRQRYNVDIRFKKLPCLDVSKAEGRPNYIPMELCVICEGQRYPKDNLNSYQFDRLRSVACPRVQERLRIINDIVKQPDGPRGGSFLGRYKMSVDAEMTHVTGRVLEAPKLRLGDGGKIREITPRVGDRQWSLLNSHVFDGRQIDRWGIVYFLEKGQGKLMEKFCNALVARFQDLGINMAKNPIVFKAESFAKLDNAEELHEALMAIHAESRGHLQILICVMGDRQSGYKQLKLICETQIGMLTQCCLFQNVRRFDEQKFGPRYLGNLALKINAKVGGTNAALAKSLSKQFPRFGNSHVVYFGADVNHPGKRDGKSPSIAAVVMSINWPYSTRYVIKIRSQKSNQEHISDLGDMCKELLDEYLKTNKKLPERVVFFRDGVSEGQFAMVLNEELVDLKMAFSRFGEAAYNPYISFIVAQKRHHTRLFPSGDVNTRSGNVPPGTVVDTVIIHPREFDFFLCSHYGQLGTSKPTHYHVLWDENEFGSDELQGLINDLCYTYARCTMPISLVPPVYYADLAAYKGRLYMEALTSSQTSSMSPPSSSSIVNAIPKINSQIENKMFI